LKIFKKLLPFTSPETDKPLHAGEIYYLWVTLTSSYNLISLVETYLMNTDDKELHILLQGIVTGAYKTRINRLERVLKEEGFTVPPQPSPKTLQGKPGAGQEVKLDDDEVLRDMVAWGQVLLQHDVRAVGAATREPVRKIFTDLLSDDMKDYNLLVNLGKKRRVFNPPPPATASDNSLNMGEVATIWDELGARHLSVVNLETYLANTNDPELIKVLKNGLNEVVLPQLEQLENVLKQEGFTVPSRPVRRMNQGPPGQVNKIILSDFEVIRILTSAMQVAIDHHVKSFSIVMREDISEMFKRFLSTEIEYFQKIMALAVGRNALSNPPAVTSKRG
jgi:spore coat protein CotF